MSGNFEGNTLTQSEAIKTYTPYDVTSSRPQKTKIAFFANFGEIEKLFCTLENYESVQHKLQFSGIKKGAKISFHRYFKLNFLFASAVLRCLLNDIALKGFLLQRCIVFRLFCVAKVISESFFLRGLFSA